MNPREESTRPDSPHPRPKRIIRALDRTLDDEESLGIIRLAAGLGIFFLLAYTIFDLRFVGGRDPAAVYHWLLLAGTCLYAGLTWTPLFRRYWQLWTLLICAFLIQMFVLVSGLNRDPESRYIAILLCPLCTASFVAWGPLWQFAMAMVSLASFWIASTYVPVDNQYIVYRWFGLLAALLLAQCTAVFIDRYRMRLRGQLAELDEAASFRENTIETMAHDIRSPVAALAGYAHLLEEEGLLPKERADLLGRLGATAWNMDLVVGNLLDSYQIRAHQIAPSLSDVDPNLLVAEVIDDCATQAWRRRVRIRSDFGPIPQCRLDPRLLERILKNLLAHAIARMNGGEVQVSIAIRDGALLLEVADRGPPIEGDQVDKMFLPPNHDDRSVTAGALGLYVARAMAEASGGRVEARYAPGQGLSLIALLPLDGGMARRATS
ncbi:MAG TPA: HAMP domain-containing sensor histidine kinase [Candidatus Binataceae bacterium]